MRAVAPPLARVASPLADKTAARIVGPVHCEESSLGFVETWTRLGLGLLWIGLCTVAFLFVLVLFLPSRAARIRVGNVYGTLAGKGCAWLTGSQFRITGQEHADGRRPCLYLANHASLLDIFLGIWLSPTGTCGVGKKEIVYYPFFGQFFWLSGHLTIDRSNNQSAVDKLKNLAAFVQQHGLSIFIWPEGTRSKDGRLRPFKRGAFHLALATGLPIVPMVIAGTQRAWENRSLRLNRTCVDVTFLPAIDTSSWTRDNLDAHIAEIERVFAAHLPEDQKPLPSAAPLSLAA